MANGNYHGARMTILRNIMQLRPNRLMAPLYADGGHRQTTQWRGRLFVIFSSHTDATQTAARITFTLPIVITHNSCDY